MARVPPGLFPQGLFDLQAARGPVPGGRLRSGIGLRPLLRFLVGQSQRQRSAPAGSSRLGAVGKPTGRADSCLGARSSGAGRPWVRAGDHCRRPSRLYEALRETCPRPGLFSRGNDLAVEAGPGDRILDCVLVEPDEWWIGFHRAHAMPSRWPGGMPQLEMPADAVSRAWLKMEEALRWSQMPLRPGRGVRRSAVPRAAQARPCWRGVWKCSESTRPRWPRSCSDHPGFRHIRRRAAEVPRREFRKIRWLTADMNVAPQFTLDAVGSNCHLSGGECPRHVADVQAARVETGGRGAAAIWSGCGAGAITWFVRGSYCTIARSCAWRRCRNRFGEKRRCRATRNY